MNVLQRFLTLFILLGVLMFFVWCIGSTPRDVRTLAQEIVAKCREESDHVKCYEREVPSFFPKLSVSRIFDIVREIRREDTTYQFCHVLGHKIGERVVAEDPARWIEAIPLNPSDGLCSNGFIHGVIGGRFRAEVLNDATIQKFLPDFTRACASRANWQPSDLDRAICYHGMGHLYDFITNANLPRALSLCKETAPEDFRLVCIEGVFMQIYQPLEPDDFLLIKQMPVQPSTTTVRQFCAAYKDPVYVGACLRESWPYFREGILNGTGAEAFCSGQPNREEEMHCYESISAIVGRMSLEDPHKATGACENFPADFREGCYTASAQAVLEEDRTEGERALALCDLASEHIARACKAHLAEHAYFIYGDATQEYTHFCSLLPDDLRFQCGKTQ